MKRPTLLSWLAWSILAGAVAAAIRVAAVDRDLAHGLHRLAAERALAIVALHAACGATGYLLSAAAGGRWLRLARNAGAFGIGAVFAGVLASGIRDAWVPNPLARADLAGRPNLLLVVLDTVRADRLSTYGYAQPTAPELDAFAREAIRYERFWSTAPWTVPGHASLFTGAYPMHHGATQERPHLAARFATLAERLRNAGFATFAASANPLVGPLTGLDQGFAEFVEAWRPDDPPPGTARHPVTRAFAAFLADQPRERPFFAFLNYADAHFPHTPPPELRDRFAREPIDAREAERVGWRLWFEHYSERPLSPAELARRSDLYDAEIAGLSAEIGRLLDTLRADGRYADTAIAITSDHGEQFGEHGLVEHAFSVYEPLLRIPLLLRLPGGDRAGSVDERTGQILDLFPTLLELCGLDAGASAPEAADLLDPSARREDVIAEYYFPNATLGWVGDERVERAGDRIAPHLRRLRSIAHGDHKLIWSSDGRRELYDLHSDPGESRELLAAGDAAERARELEARLAAALARFAEPWASAPPRPARALAPIAPSLDPESAEQLKRLGYLP